MEKLRVIMTRSSISYTGLSVEGQIKKPFKKWKTVMYFSSLKSAANWLNKKVY